MNVQDSYNSAQEQLRAIIMEMASESAIASEDVSLQVGALVEFFKSHETFRHMYARLPVLISDIYKSPYHEIEYLSEALVGLHEHLMLAPDGKWRKNAFRLCDHLMLEIARFNEINQYSGRTQKDIEASVAKLEAAQKDLETVSHKLQSVQTEVVTVLSIFAAIVLAVSGSVSFIGNSLSSIGAASTSRAAVLIALCGIVTFNTVFVLMYCIAKMIERPIASRCNKFSCNQCAPEACRCKKRDCHTCTKKCWFITRMRYQMPFAFYLNAFLLLIIFCAFVHRYVSWDTLVGCAVGGCK